MLATLALFPAIARAAFGNSTAVDCGVRGILYGRRPPSRAAHSDAAIRQGAARCSQLRLVRLERFPTAGFPSGRRRRTPPCGRRHTPRRHGAARRTPLLPRPHRRVVRDGHCHPRRRMAPQPAPLRQYMRRQQQRRLSRPPTVCTSCCAAGATRSTAQPLTLARPNVTVRAEGGDAVAAVLDGGVTVTLASPWAPAPAPFPKGVMAARVAPGRFPTDVTGAGGLPQSLYVDGARYVRARRPERRAVDYRGPVLL